MLRLHELDFHMNEIYVGLDGDREREKVIQPVKKTTKVVKRKRYKWGLKFKVWTKEE
uniref:Uncharacterized protein n=1 Tax=Arion vulgaris TaxID=1028688 RepID=A0A0B7AI99_9EUPU